VGSRVEADDPYIVPRSSSLFRAKRFGQEEFAPTFIILTLFVASLQLGSVDRRDWRDFDEAASTGPQRGGWLGVNASPCRRQPDGPQFLGPSCPFGESKPFGLATSVGPFVQLHIHQESKVGLMARDRVRETKTKACFRCAQPTKVAYRVRHDASRRWEFVCPDCLEAVRSGNPLYTYGGTWKSSRH